MTDPAGVVVAMGYDAHGELVSTTDGAGNVARLERDDTGRVTAAVSPSGHRTRYVYDSASGLLAQRVDADGARWAYEYTTGGRATVLVDPAGGRTELEYGPHGEESATIDPLGRAITRRYDDLGFVAGATLPDGSRWEFAHDALGRLTHVTDPDGAVATTEYDVSGAPSATTDPTGVRREVHDIESGAQNGTRNGAQNAAQSGAGAAMEIIDGPASTRLDVDKLGRLVSETGPDGTTRLTRYDRCGRPVEVVDPVGGLTRLVRDSAGRVSTMVKPSGSEIGYTYDACGRLETITDETGATSTRVYDTDSHVVEQHLPGGDVATTRFDEVGRVLSVRVPGAGTTTYTYDAVGRVAETRDPVNGRRRFTYDAAGQLVAATDANDGVTGYAYDTNGRCVTITHADGGETLRAYDANSHVVAETDPLGRRTTATYDAAGRQVTQTDPAGSTTEWRYDEHGMLASTWVDGVEQSSIERNVPGRKVRIIDRTGLSGAVGAAGEVTVHELEWDARGLLVARTRDGRGPVWDYDADGRCTALTAPDGTRTDYARDAAGRLVGVTHPLLGTAVIERDVAGRMLSATAGGTTQRWTYADGYLTTHEVEGPEDSDEAGARTTLARDDDGRITRVDTSDGGAGQSAQSTAYDYDAACQLVAAATTTPDGTETVRWRYDAAGRLVGESLDGAARELAYDLAGQLTATRVDGEDVATYSYDPVGRRTAEEYADGSSRAYSWSPTGWLSAIATTDRLGDTRRTDLVVDALGELARIDDGSTGRSSEVFTDTAHPFNGILAAGEQQIVGAGPFTGVSNGSEAQWSQPGWRDARATGPDPWSLPTDGMPDLPSGPSTSTAGFEVTPTGDLLIGGSGDGTGQLEWLGSRVYDPSARGFLSVDPLEATTGSAWAGNPYSYAGNDPLHALDPMGLHPVTDAELKAYNDHNGGLGDTAVGKWAKKNWEYVAAGAMVIGGAALMFVPGGQAVGMGLISAGVDTAIQKATTGHVNWGEVVVSGVAGGVSMGAGSLMAKGGVSALKVAVTTGAVDGGINGGGMYMTGPGPHTPGGLIKSTAFGAGVGGATGGVMHGAGALGGKVLSRVEPRPHVDTAALEGRANEVHSALDPRAQRSRTTAALQTSDGTTVLASGGRDLSPAQRAMARDGEVLGKSPGAHAEVTAHQAALERGMSPSGMGVSRPICPECRGYLEDSGATITSPNNRGMVTLLQTYDEAAMDARLTRLDRRGRTSFAAGCAEMLLPLHRRDSDGETPDTVEAALDALWQTLRGTEETDLPTRLAELDTMVPDEDSEEWSLQLGYTENTVAATAYAIETWQEDTVQNAVWAARQVYEAADLAAQHSEAAGIDLNSPGAEQQILASATVQTTLEALDALLVQLETADSPGTVRSEARASGQALVARFPA